MDYSRGRSDLVAAPYHHPSKWSCSHSLQDKSDQSLQDLSAWLTGHALYLWHSPWSTFILILKCVGNPPAICPACSLYLELSSPPPKSCSEQLSHLSAGMSSSQSLQPPIPFLSVSKSLLEFGVPFNGYFAGAITHCKKPVAMLFCSSKGKLSQS